MMHVPSPLALSMSIVPPILRRGRPAPPAPNREPDRLRRRRRRGSIGRGCPSGLQRDLDARRLRMFRRVGQGFRCNVVRRDLDRLRQPLFDVLLLDGIAERRASARIAGQGLLGEDRRMDPARSRAVRPGVYSPAPIGDSPEWRSVGSGGAPATARSASRRNEPLLRAVVQVALDAATSLVRAATIRPREAASSDLLSAFAIAVATSSVNFSRRRSVSDGKGCLAATER